MRGRKIDNQAQIYFKSIGQETPECTSTLLKAAEDSGQMQSKISTETKSPKYIQCLITAAIRPE